MFFLASGFGLLLSSMVFFILGGLFYVETLSPQQWLKLKPQGFSVTQWQQLREQLPLLPFVEAFNEQMFISPAYQKAVILSKKNSKDLNKMDMLELLTGEPPEAIEDVGLTTEAENDALMAADKAGIETQELPELTTSTIAGGLHLGEQAKRVLKQETELTEVTGSYGLNLNAKTAAAMPNLLQTSDMLVEGGQLLGDVKDKEKQTQREKLAAYQRMISKNLSEINSALKNIKH